MYVRPDKIITVTLKDQYSSSENPGVTIDGSQGNINFRDVYINVSCSDVDSSGLATGVNKVPLKDYRIRLYSMISEGEKLLYDSE